VENITRVWSREESRSDSRFGQIIGNSPALESVLGEVERVAPTDSTVLVLGET
jgi:formate hydrogenlyase transcriptional activator